MKPRHPVLYWTVSSISGLCYFVKLLLAVNTMPECVPAVVWALSHEMGFEGVEPGAVFAGAEFPHDGFVGWVDLAGL